MLDLPNLDFDRSGSVSAQRIARARTHRSARPNGRYSTRLQLQPTGDITFRRLVLDETDLLIANQLHRSAASKTGEVKPVVLFFSDVAGFTSFSETLTPYDVMYLLNRYFAEVGELIERNDGYIDKFVGDGLMAIFGIEVNPTRRSAQ